MRFSGIQTASKGISFFRLLKSLILFLAVISLLFNVIQVFNESHQISPVIKELGSELFNPFYNLKLVTQNILINGFYPHTGFFFMNIWGFLKNFYHFFLPLINLYFVFNYLFLFVRGVILGDKSRDFPAFLVTTIIFFLLNLVYIASSTNLPTLITALKNTFEIISRIFT